MEFDTIEANNQESLFFNVLDENNQEYTITLNTNNNDLILEIINSEDDINLYDKKYISKNSFDSLRHNQKIFSIFDSLDDIKKLISDIVTKKENYSRLRLKKEFNKYNLIIPISYMNINQITFEFFQQEKNLKEIIKQLIVDNKKKDQEIIKMKKELSLAKELINNLKDEMDIFNGEGTFYICSALDQNMCFDIISERGHCYLMINKLNKNNTQKFKVKTKDNNIHYIMNYLEDKIIDIYDANTSNGTNIIVHNDIHFKKNQLWKFFKRGEFCYIKSCNCECVIDIPNGELKNNNKLIIWGFNGNLNQLWKFIRTE